MNNSFNISNLRINHAIKKHKKNGTYSIFKSSLFKSVSDKKTRKYLLDIFFNIDDNCNIPEYCGKMLDELYNNSNYVVGIHRTNLYDLDIDGSNVRSEMLETIANEGIINQGHLVSSGFYEKCPPLSRTLSDFKGIAGYINLFGSYKDNNAIIITAFPSEIVNEELEFKNNDYAPLIYNFVGNSVYIKPEYIVGTIIKNENGNDIYLSYEEMLNVNSHKMNVG